MKEKKDDKRRTEKVLAKYKSTRHSIGKDIKKQASPGAKKEIMVFYTSLYLRLLNVEL